MTVDNWGTSKPDFYQTTTPAKSIVGTEGSYQMKWTDLETATVDPGSALAVEAYIVPNSYDLHLGGGIISCNISGIQMVRLVHTPGILGDFRFDMRGDLILTELSTHILDAGDDLTYYLFNYLDVPAQFSVSLTGFLVKV